MLNLKMSSVPKEVLVVIGILLPLFVTWYYLALADPLKNSTLPITTIEILVIIGGLISLFAIWYPLIIFKEMGEAKVVLSVIGVFISLSIIGTPLVTYARHLDSIKYAEGSQFVEMINKARNCTNDLSFIDDGLGTHNEHLKYPKHSLVVYKVLTDNKPTIWDTQGDPDLYKPNHEMIYEDYHYNSPSEWLASKKSQVKLIVLVSVGKTEVIGYYQNTGGIPAHKTTYNLSFYDVKTGTIVAKRIIVLFDTDTLNTLDFSNSESWPSNSQVIEQIRNTITFQGD